MSSPFVPDPIRIACDLKNQVQSPIQDLNANGAPASFVRGDQVEIDIAIFESGSLLTGLTQTGPGGISSVAFYLYQNQNDSQQAGVLMGGQGYSVNVTGLTTTQWNAGGSANCHFKFIFTTAQTSLSIGGATSISYWMRIVGTSSDNPPVKITLLEGPIQIMDGPIASTATPTYGTFRSYDANGQTVPQLLCSDGLYHTLIGQQTSPGVFSLTLSDTGYA
jgi:hypothetical protein